MKTPKVIPYLIGIIVLFSLLLHRFYNLEQAVWCILGGLTMLLNWWVLVWAWKRIFLKKSIALAVSVIVFKYSILGFIVYYAVTATKERPIGFVVGLSSIVLVMPVVALKHSQKHKS